MLMSSFKNTSGKIGREGKKKGKINMELKDESWKKGGINNQSLVFLMLHTFSVNGEKNAMKQSFLSFQKIDFT